MTRYGVPLVSTDEAYEHVQIAIVDDQLQDAYSVLLSADFHDDQKGSRWVVSGYCKNNNTTGGDMCFVSMSSVHVELFAGFAYCRFPTGAFDRAVVTAVGSSNRLPLLQDFLLSLKRSKLEPINYNLGGAFASMLIDVYRLDEDWIVNALSAIDDDQTVCQELVEVISRQRKAFRETKPTGWILQKFFTNGRPLTQPLYQALCGGHNLVDNWPPKKRVDWVYDDPSAGNCSCGNEREEGEGRSRQLWSMPGPVKQGNRDAGDGDGRSGHEDGGGGDQDDADNEDANDEDSDDEHADDKDVEPDLPPELLLIAAKRCVEVLEGNKCGPFAFIGGFAIQRMGKAPRATGDIDFVCEQFGKCKTALEHEDDFDVPQRLAAGALQAYCTLTSSTGEKTRVPINALRCGEFGPVRLRNRTIVVDTNIPVLNWTEILRMKIRTYATRQGGKDKDDIKYIMENHRAELDDGRVEDVVFQEIGSFPQDLQDLLSVFVDWIEGY